MKALGLILGLIALYKGQENLPIGIAIGIVGLFLLLTPKPHQEPIEEETSEETEEESQEFNYLAFQKSVGNIPEGKPKGGTKALNFTDYKEFEDVGHRVKPYRAKRRRRRKKKNSLFNDF